MRVQLDRQLVEIRPYDPVAARAKKRQEAVKRAVMFILVLIIGISIGYILASC